MPKARSLRFSPFCNVLRILQCFENVQRKSITLARHLTSIIVSIFRKDFDSLSECSSSPKAIIHSIDDRQIHLHFLRVLIALAFFGTGMIDGKQRDSLVSKTSILQKNSSLMLLEGENSL
jgi:hypothetical protein